MPTEVVSSVLSFCLMWQAAVDAAALHTAVTSRAKRGAGSTAMLSVSHTLVYKNSVWEAMFCKSHKLMYTRRVCEEMVEM